MKDLIAKLQLDANCAMGAIWLHIEAREKRVAELEAELAALRSAPLPADTDKLREALKVLADVSEIFMAGGVVGLRPAIDKARLVLSTAGQAPVREVPEPQGWREAMQEFVDRCERGEILSRYTYAKFKALLAPLPAALTQTEDV